MLEENRIILIGSGNDLNSVDLSSALRTQPDKIYMETHIGRRLPAKAASLFLKINTCTELKKFPYKHFQRNESYFSCQKTLVECILEEWK